MTTEDPVLIATGEFGRRTQLSRKALALYDVSGLLVPRELGGASGHRRYAVDQIGAGRLISLLRGAGLSLAEIGPLVTAVADNDLALAGRRLDQLLADTERHDHGRLLVIGHVGAILSGESDATFAVRTREVPAQRLMSIQTRLHADMTETFVTQARAAFTRHLDGARPAGRFTLIFHGPVSQISDGPVEAVLGVGDDVEGDEEISVRSEPAHEQAYTTVTKRQWAYPAILAAYDAVACSAEASGRQDLGLPCREVYLADPARAGDDDPVCEVVFPLAPRG